MIWKPFFLCAFFLVFFKTVFSKEELEYYKLDYAGETFVTSLNNDESNDGDNGANYNVANANVFLDMMLKNAEKTIKDNKLDPLTLPDTTKLVKQRLLVLVLEGGYSTRNGKLHGLSTIHRAGNSTLENKRDSMETVATLSFRHLSVETDAQVWLTAVNVPFRMIASIEYLKATITVVIPLNNKGEKIRATSFVINEIGRISMKFKNLGPLNWLLDGLGSLVTNMLKNVIKNQISHKMLDSINSVIPKLAGSFGI